MPGRNSTSRVASVITNTPGSDAGKSFGTSPGAGQRRGEGTDSGAGWQPSQLRRAFPDHSSLPRRKAKFPLAKIVEQRRAWAAQPAPRAIHRGDEPPKGGARCGWARALQKEGCSCMTSWPTSRLASQPALIPNTACIQVTKWRGRRQADAQAGQAGLRSHVCRTCSKAPPRTQTHIPLPTTTRHAPPPKLGPRRPSHRAPLNDGTNAKQCDASKVTATTKRMSAQVGGAGAGGRGNGPAPSGTHR
jgi:hypothetical protein